MPDFDPDDYPGVPGDWALAWRHARKALKSARSLANKGRATQDDVEDFREACQILQDVIQRQNWRK